jgi:phosphohistidine phosphatase SixA
MRSGRIFWMLAVVCVASLSAAAGAQAPAGATASGFAEVVATSDTVAALRAGGLALYLRHAPTDNTRPDRVPAVDLADCSTQRPLSDEGRGIAARVGAALREAGVPIGDIHVSPMCRTRDTAAAAFPGRGVIEDDHLVYTANLTDAQKAPILARTRALLSAPVPAGTNRLLVAHAPNLMDLVGYFPKETTLVVFRPRGDGHFDYVASIPSDLWPSLPGGR